MIRYTLGPPVPPTFCHSGDVCDLTAFFCPTEQKEEEVIERKGCLPRAQCPLLGHATYWSRSYSLRHQCCEQDLCNAAASQPPPNLPLMTLLPLAAMIGWGVHDFL